MAPLRTRHGRAPRLLTVLLFAACSGLPMQPQRSARRAAITASTGQPPPNSVKAMGKPRDAPLADGPFGLAMIGAFRLAMGRMAGWQSPRPFFSPSAEPGESYRGLVEVSRRLFATSREETVALVVGVLRQFPTKPQLLGDNRLSAELLGVLTPPLFRFLVGPSTTEAWLHPSGEQWRSRVVIEKCRFLEASECKGMCVGLCKQPTERFFGEELGLPLHMEPNFEDGSCAMTWGEPPRPEALAEQNLGCFRECSLRSSGPAGAPRPSCDLVTQHAVVAEGGRREPGLDTGAECC